MKRARQGFTLAELLVVVAILGILTATSIPLYNGLIEASKEKTDNNYIAVAKTAYMAEYDSYDETTTDANSFANSVQYYDLANHEFYTVRTGIKGYGQGTAAGDDPESHEGMLIACTYDDGDVDAEWTTPALTIAGDNTTNPLLTTSTAMSSVYAARTWSQDDFIDSGNVSDEDRDTIQKYLEENFPNANITAWRITRELDNGNADTITITDVDISKLAVGTKVKVIRYNTNPKKLTYTAAYVKIVSEGSGANAYNALGIASNLKDAAVGWEELPGQTTDTKKDYAATVNIYNNYPATK